MGGVVSASRIDVARLGFLGFSGYQWLVIAAAWAGWGFDVFDALLFNFVAPNCVPVLLGLQPGAPGAHEATVFWTGAITSILLVGWAAGGVLFGWLADRIGRRHALFATILVYAAGTALCAAATNIWQLIAFRALASLGIGGEWGIGAALVAETVPESRRVEAGVILQTSSPLGVVLASTVNYLVAGVWFAATPQTSWRYVFLAGLVPVILAALIRIFVRESPHWTAAAAQEHPPSPRELFSADIRKRTISGAGVAVTAVVSWWACNAFVPLLGSTLAGEHAAHLGLSADAARLLAEKWKAHASNAFNIGGLLGAFAAIALSRTLGRRPMYVAYFAYSALMLFVTFGLNLAPPTRLAMLFFVGAGVYGVFGTFPFYLPELFPARLRATGSGFCYNIGRLVAAGGPLFVGMVSARAGGSSAVLSDTLVWVGVVPLVAALCAKYFIVETRDRPLQ
jgi:MFS family permease